MASARLGAEMFRWDDRSWRWDGEDRQLRFEDAAALLGDRLQPGDVYRRSAEHWRVLFDDRYFADFVQASR